jgi:hypothetical protein
MFTDYTAVNLTGSNAVSAITGDLLGFYVNSTNAGTLVLKHNPGTDAGTALSGTITPAIGFHYYPLKFSKGLYAKIGGTALNVTFFIK